jgi:serine/threonine protein kinase
MIEPSQSNIAVAQLFDELVELPRAQRRARLEQDDLDPTTRLELESLLAAHDDAGEFLREATDAPHVGDPFDVGTKIDRYELLEQIGEGGFARVFRASQSHPVRREVALKIVKVGMDTRALVARFTQERQALAMMDHPNIAAVFDAGATDNGRPFFVMELVRGGQRITRYCDDQCLNVRQRLALFIDVCHGVQHAHQKGVLHRDLKPSNILVTTVDGRPMPKIIDFGIAKAIHDQQLVDATIVTSERQMLGTPQYMSPEQARSGGTDVDTRSDIYSLGAVLYELLTGAAPLDDATQTRPSGGLDHLQRLTGDHEIARASTRVVVSDSAASTIAEARGTTAGELRWTLKGELDWIIAKCLEKDRSRRYESAAALAADIEAFRNHRPITAAPPTLQYRARKFVRRNTVAVLASAVVMVALLAGAIISTTQAVRARRAERLGQKRLDDSVAANANLQAVNEFLTRDMIGSADPYASRGRELQVREALDKAAAALPTKFKDKPVIEAVVRHSVAAAYLALGRADLALPHARQALDARRQLLGDSHPDTIVSLDTYGEVLRYMGRLNEAEPVALDAYQRSKRVNGDDHVQTVRALQNYAQVLMSLGRWRDAETYAKKTVDELRRHFGEDNDQTIAAVNDWCVCIQGAGRPADAVPVFRETLDRCRRVLGDDHPRTTILMHNFAHVLQLTGQLAEAEQLLRQALEIRRRIFGPDNPETLATLNNYAMILENLHRPKEAEPLLKEAMDGRRRALGDDHVDTIATIGDYATVLRSLGRINDAEPYAREAMERSRKTLGDDHPLTLTTVNNYGVTLGFLNRRAEAVPFYQLVLDGRRRVLGPDHPETLKAMFNCASNLSVLGRHAEAEPIAAELYAKAPRAQVAPAMAAIFTTLYGACLAKQERYDQAEAPLREAYRRMRETGQGADARMRTVTTALADVCEHTNRPDEAARLRSELQAMRPYQTTRPASQPAATQPEGSAGKNPA